MTKLLVGTLTILGIVQSPAQAPPTKAPLAFEVATIRPTAPDARGGGIRPMPAGQGYVATGIPLKLMIRLMYTLTDSQVVGGPDWINTDRWDVQAKADHSANINELHEMFQTLMADRFQLKFHKENKDLPMYELVLDKPGSASKLKVNDTPNKFDIPIIPAGRGHVNGTRVGMSYLAWFLSQQLNRPVVDKTGLDQFYDFELQWTLELPDGARPPGADAPAPPEVPTIFAALREQLGLKLESKKGPVEVYVIDHAEKPSGN